MCSWDEGAAKFTSARQVKVPRSWHRQVARVSVTCEPPTWPHRPILSYLLYIFSSPFFLKEIKKERAGYSSTRIELNDSCVLQPSGNGNTGLILRRDKNKFDGTKWTPDGCHAREVAWCRGRGPRGVRGARAPFFLLSEKGWAYGKTWYW